jgi:hypothetical protein
MSDKDSYGSLNWEPVLDLAPILDRARAQVRSCPGLALAQATVRFRTQGRGRNRGDRHVD